MLRLWGFFLFAILRCTSAVAQQPDSSPINLTFQKALLDLRRVDQSALMDKTMHHDQLDGVLRANERKLKELIAANGWPALSVVGNEAAQGAWLIVQHADHDRAWQRDMLVLMEGLIPRGEVRKTDVAYLRDRLDVADQLPQRYGSQGRCIGKNTWEPFKLANLNNVDEWRKSMGMSTLDAYIEYAGRTLCENFQSRK